MRKTTGERRLLALGWMVLGAGFASCDGEYRPHSQSLMASLAPEPGATTAYGTDGGPAMSSTAPPSGAPIPSSAAEPPQGPESRHPPAVPDCTAASDAGCVSACAGCSILGVCVEANSPNPANACQVCDPLLSASDWSPIDGRLCDDASFCTVDDTCSSGECVGRERPCDDGVACNGVSRCDESSDACIPGANQCPANTPCDTATGQCVSTCNGCSISGSCVLDGSTQPGNSCALCDTARSTTTYSNAADGAPCSLGGNLPAQCQNGVCTQVLLGNGAPCTTGNQCQSGSCNGGFCCSGPCSGVCATCQQGTGACIAPADDPICPAVTCSEGACKVSQTINSGGCRAVNQCKSVADCPTLASVPNRMPCGPPDSGQRCIDGSCAAPSVLCGGVSQEITAGTVCCGTSSAATGPREGFTNLTNCPPSYLDSGGTTTTPITCDDNDDCRLGDICCHRSVGESAIECTLQSECERPMNTRRVVCSSPQGPVATCQRGTCAALFLEGAFAQGWGFCE